ncbi:MAG: copper resistance D family protein [Telluria sp.]
MAFDLLLAERAATVVLNASAAITAGGSLATSWLGDASSTWAGAKRDRLVRWGAGGSLLAVLASVILLWLKAADLAEVPPAQALGAVRMVLGSSHYGVAWTIGAAALLVAGLVQWATRRVERPRRAGLLTLVPLAVFWYAQCMSSHGAEDGDASVFMLVYSAHLALTSLWVGEVLVAGLIVLRDRSPLRGQEAQARAGFVQRLSDSATLALVGVLLTGGYLGWHLLRRIGDLVDDPYGRTLLAKLALVAVAAAMGGFNRFFVMPAFRARQSDQAATEGAARFRRVLLAETAILLGALVLAAILGSTAPPGTAM